MSNNTAQYWKKYLGLERPTEKSILVTVQSRLRVFRSLIIWLTSLFIDKCSKLSVEGLKNLMIEPPFIIAFNHLSNIDYPYLVRRIPKNVMDNTYVVAKKWLFEHVLARIFVQATANCVFVDVHDDYLKALRAASDILRLGKSIFIAPEGRRSPDGQIGEFKVGVGVLAVENNVPIIPVRIEGTNEVLPRGKFFPRIGKKVAVKFGKPLYPQEFVQDSTEENMYYVYKKITEKLREKVCSL